MPNGAEVPATMFDLVITDPAGTHTLFGPPNNKVSLADDADGLQGRTLGRFDQGLYGCSEMFVNGFMRLIDAGIIRREVFNDPLLQQLIKRGRST